jgi:phage terminase small subunit
MNSNPEQKFQIAKTGKNTFLRHESNQLLPLDWLSGDTEWDKKQFISDVANFIESTQVANTFPNMILIEMLGTQIEIYIQCIKKLDEFGLIETYNKGATSGPSVYFTMSDKALNRALQIMKELGITPTHRIGIVKSKSPEAFEIEEFLAGPF